MRRSLKKKAKGRSRDMSRRQQAAAQQFYQPTSKTEELAETHYYKVRLGSDTRSLVPVNEFWAEFADYNVRCAAGGHSGPFVSRHFAVVAGGSLTQSLLALAVVDLPFDGAGNPAVSVVGQGRLRYACSDAMEGRSGGMVLFHKAVSEAEAPAATSILVGQHYFDPKDRHTGVGANRRDKYITDFEFLPGKVCVCVLLVVEAVCAVCASSVRLTYVAPLFPLSRCTAVRWL